MNVAIIGMRGAGKSNVSRRLGFLTKRPVMSTDVLVEYETGMTIPDFVADHGWPAFRLRELAIVERLAAMDRVIVDCGGGIVVDVDPATGEEVYSERKVRALRDRGPVVWLRGDIDGLAAKTAADPLRPALDTSRDAAEIMRRRLPFYEAAADHVIDVDASKRSVMALDLALRYADDLALSPDLVRTLQAKRG